MKTAPSASAFGALAPLLRKLKAGLAELYGERLSRVILYGSQARGEADEDSDIDVLVVLKGEVRPGEEIERCGNLTAALSLEYDTLISTLYMSEAAFEARKEPLLDNVYEERALMTRAETALKAVQFLFEGGFFNDAASRAYYSMFYVAQAFLAAEGMSFSSHNATIAAFGQHIARKGLVPLDFHKDLIKAQDARHLGDYTVTVELRAEDVEVQLERARRFLEIARQTLT